MAVLGAHRADEPKAASVMPSPLEGLNWTMVDHSLDYLMDYSANAVKNGNYICTSTHKQTMVIK